MPLLGTRGAASAKGFGFTSAFVAPPGQQAYTTAGTYNWIAPAGVTSVSVVCVGGASGVGPQNQGAGGGGGGGLGYKNNYTVTPGNSYTVVVGAAGPVGRFPSSNGGDSYFISTATVKGGGGIVNADTSRSPATYTGDGGGNGGDPNGRIAGSGAGGYSGQGGQGDSGNGAGGGGGGGGYNGFGGGAGGGGVGILGQGASGAGGTNLPGGPPGASAQGGGGGSGGATGTGSPNGTGGLYGGGGGQAVSGSGGGTSVAGAVRIIWPGTTRTFPSTNTGNL